ncbi:carbon-monoxide dehydrogenase large subunit [Mameliella alba]|nr:carbon-monoxide dehydrogenase large subunit [Mameliella alba]SDC43412.1 carbon-monoxide dehydrogenase large subunit [Mameliella alba]
MMDDVQSPEERSAGLKGMGCSRKRVEDVRFTQGKGTMSTTSS